MTAINGTEYSPADAQLLQDYDRDARYLQLSPEAKEDWIAALEVRLELQEEAKRRHAERKAERDATPPFADRLFTPSQAIVAQPPPPLIRDVLDEGATAMLIGTRGTGKTFVATDMALCIATGQMWARHTVTQGRVLFVVGEGGRSAYGIRIEAWCKHRGEVLADLDSRMTMVDGAVPFRSSQWEDLVAFVKDWRPALVVLDTLARHQVGMEANSNDDAAEGLDKAAVLQQLGAAVLLLHHPAGSRTGGVNASRGATGWEAGTDAVFTLESSDFGDDAPADVRGLVTMTCTKQKHREDGQTWDFRQTQVPVSNSTWTTSVVMEEVDAYAKHAAENEAKNRHNATRDEDLMEFIRETKPDTLGAIEKWGATKGYSRRKVKDSAARLKRGGRVTDLGTGTTWKLRAIDPVPVQTPSEAPMDP